MKHTHRKIKEFSLIRHQGYDLRKKRQLKRLRFSIIFSIVFILVFIAFLITAAIVD